MWWNKMRSLTRERQAEKTLDSSGAVWFPFWQQWERQCVLYVLCCVTHLDVSNQELRWRFHWCFGINDLLDGTCPVHSLVEMLGVQPVTVLPPIYCDAPVAWTKHRQIIISICGQKAVWATPPYFMKILRWLACPVVLKASGKTEKRIFDSIFFHYEHRWGHVFISGNVKKVNFVLVLYKSTEQLISSGCETTQFILNTLPLK